MPPLPDDFVGSAFFVEGVAPLGPATLRVTFAQDPLTVDPAGTNDALNERNYDLVGVDGNYVVSVGDVTDDPQSVDLFLAAPLEAGTWTVAVSNVHSDTATTLTAPTAITFSVTAPATQALLSGGALNDDAYAVLRRHFNPALRGPGWTSVLTGIAAGDQKNFDNARKAFDQLFMSSASGRYLDERTSDFGIRRPEGMIMQDEPYRQLGLVVRDQQLTSSAIWQLLEIFYGAGAVRATLDASVPEPYALEDGDDLQIEFDRQLVASVTFRRLDFARIGRASAAEVATVVARTLAQQRQRGSATTVFEPETSTTAVRLLGGQRGLGSSVAIVGGRAQTKLLFPTGLFQTSGSSPFATWNVAPSSTTPGNVRFTMVSGIYDLSLVEPGDLVYVYGTEFAGSSNVGTFVVADVSITYSGVTLVTWFEVSNPGGGTASGVVQVLFTDLMFFRPTRRHLHDQPRSVTVGTGSDAVDVILPATTLAVERGPGIAAYPGSRAPVAIASLTRSAGVATATTGSAHGLSTGDWVFVDGVVPTGARPPVVAGTPSGNFASNVANGTTDESLASTTSEAHTFEAVNHQIVRLTEGFLLVLGGSTQVNPSTLTPLTTPVLLEVTGDTSSLSVGRQLTYRWTNLTGHTYHAGHRDFAATVLHDGRVLMTGGTNGDDVTGPALATWDLFTYTRTPPQDAQTNGALPAARSAHAQASLLDGRAIVCGGWTTPATPIATTIALDSTALTWSSVGSMTQARMRHAATVLHDGRVLAAGGQSATDTLCTCEVYDTGANTWSRTGSMSDRRYWFGAAVLPDGRVLAVGGLGHNATRSDADAPLRRCEIYDPVTGWWSPAPAMSAARVQPIVAYVASVGAVVVAGGGQASIELLDVATMTWSRSLTPAANGLAGSAGGLLASDVVAVVGGLSGTASAKLNYLHVPGQEVVRAGGLNRLTSVTVVSGTSFSFDTGPEGYAQIYSATGASAATVTPVAAVAGATPGPYTFDRDGLSVTNSATPLTGDLLAGHRYDTVPVDATVFPDAPGFLAFAFGSEGVVGPVKYFGRATSTALNVDAGFVFPVDLPAGTFVTLLAGRTAFAPASGARVGSFLLTGSAAGRVAAEAAVADAVAEGVQVRETVVYPGDRGLGNEGFPTSGSSKLTDAVEVWGGDALDAELTAARSTHG